MAIRLSGVVFLFCCQEINGKAMEGDSCPLAKLSAHCDKAEKNKTSRFTTNQTDELHRHRHCRAVLDSHAVPRPSEATGGQETKQQCNARLLTSNRSLRLPLGTSARRSSSSRDDWLVLGRPGCRIDNGTDRRKRGRTSITRRNCDAIQRSANSYGRTCLPKRR